MTSNHDLNDDVYHCCRRSDLDVCLNPLEEEFHTAKQVDQSILASADILNSLRPLSVTTTPTPDQGRHSLVGELQFR
jgi:hypothetical protein